MKKLRCALAGPGPLLLCATLALGLSHCAKSAGRAPVQARTRDEPRTAAVPQSPAEPADGTAQAAGARGDLAARTEATGGESQRAQAYGAKADPPAPPASAAPVQALDGKQLQKSKRASEERAAATTPRRATVAGAFAGSLGLVGQGRGGGGYGSGEAKASGAGTLHVAFAGPGPEQEADKDDVAKAVALPEPDKNENGVALELDDDDATTEHWSAPSEDNCGPQQDEVRPLPRRCHLASNYRAGQGIWQRRLEAMAPLPQRLLALERAEAPGSELLPPDTTALAVSARLDRERLDEPGEVWMRVSLRSTDRWGMRRPPFDLAVIVGAGAGQAADGLACRTLEALAQRIEPQDRLTLIRGATDKENLDAISGAEAQNRVRSACAQGAGWATAPLVTQHRRARALLAQHAQAQYRVAGSRLIVAIATAADLEPAALKGSAEVAVAEPTLTSVLGLDAGAQAAGWPVADAGHGLLEQVGSDPAAATQRLWFNWGRVVARLVRVDLRLAPGVVALRVVGSRALDQAETRRVRRAERAVDNNLARVAGVKSDREQDGEGMTMLIPAFLGSDEHFIDVQLRVPGPGAVADVVVDYKDLVRMSNQKAMARAALSRSGSSARGSAAPIARADLDALDWSTLAGLRAAVANRDMPQLEALANAVSGRADQALLAVFAQALLQSARAAPEPEPLLAAMDVFIARVRGCHVAAAGR